MFVCSYFIVLNLVDWLALFSYFPKYGILIASFFCQRNLYIFVFCYVFSYGSIMFRSLPVSHITIYRHFLRVYLQSFIYCKIFRLSLPCFDVVGDYICIFYCIMVSWSSILFFEELSYKLFTGTLSHVFLISTNINAHNFSTICLTQNELPINGLI